MRRNMMKGDDPMLEAHIRNLENTYGPGKWSVDVLHLYDLKSLWNRHRAQYDSGASDKTVEIGDDEPQEGQPPVYIPTPRALLRSQSYTIIEDSDNATHSDHRSAKRSHDFVSVDEFVQNFVIRNEDDARLAQRFIDYVLDKLVDYERTKIVAQPPFIPLASFPEEMPLTSNQYYYNQ